MVGRRLHLAVGREAPPSIGVLRQSLALQIHIRSLLSTGNYIFLVATTTIIAVKYQLLFLSINENPTG